MDSTFNVLTVENIQSFRYC